MIDFAGVRLRIEKNTIPIPFSGCWAWTGYIARQYPQINLGGRGDPVMAAHKASYLAFKGNVPEGMVVRHTCDVSACCNPDHLILGTTLDNVLDCVQRGRHRNQNTRRMVCKSGHPLTGENVRVEPTGFRRCLVCAAEYHRTWKLARKGVST